MARLQQEGTPTKSFKAILGIQEAGGSGLGVGALALIDVTASADSPLPSINDYKEATVGCYRSVVSVRTASAKSVEARMAEFLAGTEGSLRTPVEVFPAFINPDRSTG